MEDEEGWQDGEMMGFAANTVSGAPKVIDIDEELEAQLDVDENGWRLPAPGQNTPPQMEIGSEVEDDEDYGKLSWHMDRMAIEHCLANVGLTGTRLALQHGDEASLLRQICTTLAVKWSEKRINKQLEFLKMLVDKALDSSTLAKRVRGDNTPGSYQRLIDAKTAATMVEKRTAVIP